ncbi:MAG: extracellular solute-binding protein, partial [Alphaproteobacteria bacterium]|nr:extracellular solute-binding protein [Alphaproteobacteria bacterium]
MPVLPEHYWKGKDFANTTTLMPLGSGPYKVKSVDYGRRIVYARVKNWWAKNLPPVKGMYNFDTVSFDVYNDETVMLQAFFAGEYDLHEENIAKSWYTDYDRPPVKKGYIVKELVPNGMPQGMQAFAFNIRRPMFRDRLTREALNYAFDFAWSNRQFAYGSYKRTTSYFANSEFASSGIPQGQELKILEQFKNQLPPELFTRPFALPATSGTGYDMRHNLLIAAQLLKQAGWKIGPSGLLERNGQPFKFEFLIAQPAFERWLNPMVNNLKRLGIEATIRPVDPAQYQKRMDDFDFDMTVASFGESLSPGNEQRNYWGSAFADVRGSRNLIGIKNPVVDKLVDMIIHAPNRAALVVRVRALDRVLLWNYYVIPNWYLDAFRVAYWNVFDRPATLPKYAGSMTGVATETWWYDPAKAARIPHRFLGAR